MNQDKCDMRAVGGVWMWLALMLLAWTAAALAAEPVQVIRNARITGGLIAQIDSEDLSLRELGQRFHVRMLLADSAAVVRAQAAIDEAGLTGRFTAEVWNGGRLPFAERVLNALVVPSQELVSDEEARRVLAPRGLLITPQAVTAMPVPQTIDEWSHYLYDASGNAVSKDREVAPPRALRWWAEPHHLRSHNYSASFTGLVSAGGRVYHFVDDGTYLFDRGGTTERWSLVARDAFNGALLWKRALEGYGQPYFEDVSGQAVPDYVWRSPLSLNRRLVAQGDKVYVALSYRRGPLSVLDGATGQTLHELDLGGIVDEIVASGDLVVCRVRTEIPMPDPRLTLEQRAKIEQQLRQQGLSHHEARAELDARLLESLMRQGLERVVAVDAAAGKVLWRYDAPLVATQSLAMADGKVVFHNYQALVALDARTGQPAWRREAPVVAGRRFGVRNLLGNLLIADGKVLWTSGATGGAVCLKLADGTELWKNPRIGETGGFAFPTGRRAIGGIVYGDVLWAWSTFRLADGSNASVPNIGDMLRRGHHIRCFAGKATERFLILPHRGAEFVDLLGQQHMVNDWIRGACSYGLMPANGLVYVTPDPCSCYVGTRVNGFMALSAEMPPQLEQSPPPTSPERLLKGPAYSTDRQIKESDSKDAWPMYRHDATRSGRSSCTLAIGLAPAWTRKLGGELTQATAASGKVFVCRKDTYQLLCLDAATGQIQWRRPFPGALDGPPTIVGEQIFIGCRDGHVYCLHAADGQLVWRFRAAPQERFTLSGDRLENVWPVSSGVLYHKRLIYAVAGRNSYLDGGLHLYALDPATGQVKHYHHIQGPWPDRDVLRQGVVSEQDLEKAADAAQRQGLIERIGTQYATGYDMDGARADLLVTDGTDLYMMKYKFTPALQPVPVRRSHHTGLTPMGGKHLMANFGLLDDTMFHRSFWVHDELWPGYSTGTGFAARAGNLVVLGAARAYAAKHFEGGWYPTHKPGSGNRIVADSYDHSNTAGDRTTPEQRKTLGVSPNAGALVRTALPLWETTVPIIVRAMLVAPDGKGGELLFTAGTVEGATRSEWDKSSYYIGPGKLMVHNGADGRLLAEYELPACPVFDGMSAAEAQLLITLIDGSLLCLRPCQDQAPSRNP
jgi:outer membrane protein assembly factor BamB